MSFRIEIFVSTLICLQLQLHDDFAQARDILDSFDSVQKSAPPISRELSDVPTPAPSTSQPTFLRTLPPSSVGASEQCAAFRNGYARRRKRRSTPTTRHFNLSSPFSRCAVPSGGSGLEAQTLLVERLLRLVCILWYAFLLWWLSVSMILSKRLKRATMPSLERASLYAVMGIGAPIDFMERARKYLFKTKFWVWFGGTKDGGHLISEAAGEQLERMHSIMYQRRIFCADLSARFPWMNRMFFGLLVICSAFIGFMLFDQFDPDYHVDSYVICNGLQELCDQPLDKVRCLWSRSHTRLCECTAQ